MVRPLWLARPKALLQHGAIEDQVRLRVRFKQRLYLLEEQAGGELLALRVSVYGVVAPLLKVIGHVGQDVVYLAAQQILAVVQLRKTHISSVADFLSA